MLTAGKRATDKTLFSIFHHSAASKRRAGPIEIGESFCDVQKPQLNTTRRRDVAPCAPRAMQIEAVGVISTR
jgi:hypothetical protein